jgi:hypothetical protein
MIRQNPVQSLRERSFLLQICFATSVTDFTRGIFRTRNRLVFRTPKTLAIPSYKYARVPARNTTQHKTHATPQPACCVRCFISFVGVHWRSGEQVFGTSFSAILHRERASKVFGKHSARLLERFHIVVLYVLVTTTRLPPRQWGATRCCQARGGADRRHRLLYPIIPVSLETYCFLSLTMSFIPSMILLGLILLLQYFILNHLISIFTYVRFLYVIFVMVMIYLRINLKLKLLFFPSVPR